MSSDDDEDDLSIEDIEVAEEIVAKQPVDGRPEEVQVFLPNEQQIAINNSVVSARFGGSQSHQMQHVISFGDLQNSLSNNNANSAQKLAPNDSMAQNSSIEDIKRDVHLLDRRVNDLVSQVDRNQSIGRIGYAPLGATYSFVQQPQPGARLVPLNLQVLHQQNQSINSSQAVQQLLNNSSQPQNEIDFLMNYDSNRIRELARQTPQPGDERPGNARYNYYGAYKHEQKQQAARQEGSHHEGSRHEGSHHKGSYHEGSRNLGSNHEGNLYDGS